MSHTVRVVFICVVIFICSCSKNDLKLNEEVMEEEIELDTIVEKLGLLSRTSFVMDSTKNLILYNGANLEFDSLLVVATDTFSISPNDTQLLLGKKYQLSGDVESYELYRTEIPVIDINTDGNEIPDEPKIGGAINIIDAGESVFTSFIGIERRGGFSQTFPKKSYGIELWEDISGEDDVKESLLDMREDDDWILDGLWNEPLRIRDYTAHDVWLSMARFNYSEEEPETVLGINRRYAEVFLNGAYRGIYYLGERVDRKQLNVKKYDDNLRGELYKGANLAIGTGFQDLEDFSNSSTYWSGYEAEYPDDIGELDWTNLHGLVDFVVNSTEVDFNSNWSARLDMENMVDYFIFLNVTNAIDNTGKNLYTARYNQDSPYLFVAWDLDGTFGNSWTGERLEGTNTILSNGLYDRLLESPVFIQELKARWDVLNNSVLRVDNLNQLLDANFNYLKTNGAYERELLDSTLPFTNVDENEIDYIKSWNESRNTFFNDFVSGLE